jgi:hypothetical protein
MTLSIGEAAPTFQPSLKTITIGGRTAVTAIKIGIGQPPQCAE